MPIIMFCWQDLLSSDIWYTESLQKGGWESMLTENVALPFKWATLSGTTQFWSNFTVCRCHYVANYSRVEAGSSSYTSLPCCIHHIFPRLVLNRLRCRWIRRDSNLAGHSGLALTARTWTFRCSWLHHCLARCMLGTLRHLWVLYHAQMPLAHWHDTVVFMLR